MLKEAMLALRVTDMEYAPEICRLLKSAETDLKMAGVVISGTCVFVITEDEQTGAVTVTDESTITDDAVITAMITYTRAHFGSPADYDRLAASYDLQRRQLANATGYTDFLEEEEPDPEDGQASGEAAEGDTGTPGTETAADPEAGTPAADPETGTAADPGTEQTAPETGA